MNTIASPKKVGANQATDMRDMVAKAGLIRTRDGILKYNTTSYGNPITGLCDYTPRYPVADWVPTAVNYPTLQAISGTPAGTAIHNVTELQAMENDLSASYYLANDIDASATSGWNGGAGFEPIGTFRGIFDGNGHTVTGLYINRPSTDWIGLFKDVGSYIPVKNVGLIDVNISGNDLVGGMVGYSDSAIITNCYLTGNISGNTVVGGIVGYSDDGSATNCYSTCAVSGNTQVGGLVGSGTGTYNDCFWDTQTSGQAVSAGGTGKTTVEMKQQATFTNWDFDTIWEMLY